MALGRSTWDDMTFPATAINPPGLVSDPDWDTTKGGWLFDAASTEQLWVIGQLSHAWEEGSVLSPHFHWERSTSASGTVLWQLEYDWSVHRQAREATVTLSSSTPVENFDVLDTQMITAMDDIDATGKKISAMLVMKISRLGGSDTYAADARLLEFDIHWLSDTTGSEQRFVKFEAAGDGT